MDLNRLNPIVPRLVVAVVSGLFFNALAWGEQLCTPKEPDPSQPDYGFTRPEECQFINTSQRLEQCHKQSSCPILTAINQDRFCQIQRPDAEPQWLKESGTIPFLTCYYGLQFNNELNIYHWKRNSELFAASNKFGFMIKEDSKVSRSLSTLDTPQNLPGLYRCIYSKYYDLNSNLVTFTPAQTITLNHFQHIQTPDNRTLLHWQVSNNGTQNATVTLQLPTGINRTQAIEPDRVQEELLDITGAGNVSAYIECSIGKGLTENNITLADASTLTQLPVWVPYWNATDCNSSNATDTHWLLSPVVYNESVYNEPVPVISCGLSRNDSCNPNPLNLPWVQLLVSRPNSSEIINMTSAYMPLNELNITAENLTNNTILLDCRFRPPELSEPAEQPSAATQNYLPQLMLLSSLLTTLTLMP